MKDEKKKPDKKSPKHKEEHLSIKEWKEIMGMNRDIYTRHNGAVKRK